MEKVLVHEFSVPEGDMKVFYHWNISIIIPMLKMLI
jgi:hypothetical protein